MNDEIVEKVEEPDPEKNTSPIDEGVLKPSTKHTPPVDAEGLESSCTWNGEDFPEWYKVCRNGRVYQCLDGRWRNTGNSC